MMIELPWQPSLNTMYADVQGRRVLSAKGRLYKKTVGQLVLAGGYSQRYSLPFEGRLMVGIKYFAPSRRRYDLMNFNKALLDALTECRVYLDDSQIDDIRQIRGEVVGKPGRIVVRISEL